MISPIDSWPRFSETDTNKRAYVNCLNLWLGPPSFRWCPSTDERRVDVDASGITEGTSSIDEDEIEDIDAGRLI
jgi:hypothetical protein